jgi:hypothetical protein
MGISQDFGEMRRFESELEFAENHGDFNGCHGMTTYYSGR